MTELEFIAAVEEYGPALRRFVRTSLDGHRDTDDIVQTAIAELASASKYATLEPDTIASHLHQRVRFRMMDYLRYGHGSNPNIEVGNWEVNEDQSVHASFADAMSEPAADTALSMDIRQAIQSLSPRYRFLAVFILVRGHTHAEAALALDVTQQCVTQMYKSMCKKLKKSLVEYL